MRRFLRILLAHVGTQPRRELIHFDARGCMATDWQEVERGFIIGRYSKVLYGSSTPVEFLVVERSDGTTFDCFAADCHEGTAEMQCRTDNPDESLVGKLVYVR